MSRLLAAGSSQSLVSSSAPISGPVPCTISAWFNQSTLATAFVVQISNPPNGGTGYALLIDQNATQEVSAFSRNPTGSTAAFTTTTYTLGVWNHGCAVYDGVNQTAYLNGGSKASNAIVVSVGTGQTQCLIGSRDNSTSFMTGALAHIAIWTDALTDEEVALLAAGVSPLRIRPGSLARYWPLDGVSSPEPELVNFQAATLTNAPTYGEDNPIVQPLWPEWYDRAISTSGGSNNDTPGGGIIRVQPAAWRGRWA